MERIWKDSVKAFAEGITRDKQWRKKSLRAILEMLAEHERDIQDALLQDLGKPPYETWWSEILVVSDSAKNALTELDKWMKPDKASPQIQAMPCFVNVVPEPIGAVLVISPWNFPFMLSMTPVIGAISAGCAVVLKPAELAPATSKLLAKLLPMYLGSEAIKVVQGGADECTELLSYKWDKIIFTGSARVGRLVLSAAAKHLTPVILELGGKNPLFIDSSVDLKVAARRIAFGKWVTNNGQACASPDYILAEEQIITKLVSVLKETIREFYGEHPQKSPDLTKILSGNHFKRLNHLLNQSIKECRLVYGGEVDEKQRYIAPTMFLDVPLDSSLMKEEIFGPLLPIIKVRDVEQAIEIIRSQPKPLVVYGFTSNKRVKDKLLNQTTSGSLVFNDTIIQVGMLNLPFGGVGESGMGCYHGKYSFDSFSHRKGVLYRYCFADIPARYPPYTDVNEDLARRLMEYDFVGVLLTFLGILKRTFYRGRAT